MFKKLFGSSSSKKKKRQESSPAPAPLTLKKPKLAPKTPDGAAQGEPSSAYLEKKKSKQACATCGSTEFRESADWGYLICAVCGEASSQRIEEQEFDETEQRGVIRRMNISNMTKKDPNAKRLKREPSGVVRGRTVELRSQEELVYCFQLCLRRVAQEVCDVMELAKPARKRVMDNTRDAWREYLELAATDRVGGGPRGAISKVFYDRHINSRAYGSRFFEPVSTTASNKRMGMVLTKFEERNPEGVTRLVMSANARGLIRALEARKLQAPPEAMTTRRGRAVQLEEGEMADLLYEHDWLAMRWKRPTDEALPSALLDRSGRLKDTDYEGRRFAVHIKFKKEREKAEKKWALEEDLKLAIEADLGHSIESSSTGAEATPSPEVDTAASLTSEESSEEDMPLAVFQTLSVVDRSSEEGSARTEEDVAQVTATAPDSTPETVSTAMTPSTPEIDFDDPAGLNESAAGLILPPMDFALLLSLVLLALRRAHVGVVSGKMIEWILTGAVDYNRLHVLLPPELNPMNFHPEIEGSSSVLRPRYLPCSYQLDMILLRLRDRFNMTVPPLPLDRLIINTLKAIGFSECIELALKLLDWLVDPACPLHEVEYFPSYPFGYLYSMSNKAEDVLRPEETEPLDPPIHGVCSPTLTCAALVVIAVKLSVPGLYDDGPDVLPKTYQLSLNCVRWWNNFTSEERMDFLAYCQEELFSDYRPCLAPELQERLRPQWPYHPLKCQRGTRPALQVSESPPSQYRTFYRSRGACRIDFDNGQMPPVYAWLLDSVCSVLHTDSDDLDREISSLEDWLFKREAPARQKGDG